LIEDELVCRDIQGDKEGATEAGTVGGLIGMEIGTAIETGIKVGEITGEPVAGGLLQGSKPPKLVDATELKQEE